MSECGCGQEETCVCAGCGRIKLFVGLPQNRNDLNIKCLKHKLFICCTKAKRTTNINIKKINMRKLGRVSIYNTCLKGCAM